MNLIKNLSFLVCALLLYSCDSKDPEAMTKNLEGYWQIKTVTLPDGAVKEYTLSTVIDYIEVEGDEGFRKKVQPKLDGSFVVTNSEEHFKIKTEGQELELQYTTPFDTWTETIIDAQPDKLTVKNRDDKVYTYARFTKFDFGNDNE